ncbi:MAG: hypothetical protein EBY70_03270 [Burkholderiaceae bacterium]|nr:hypothetical protein [Burkholderiaceae bacterium]
MNNAFGLHHLWTQGDFVTHFVALLLLLMSIVTWVILISRLWGLRNIKRLKSELDSFWRARSYDEGLSHLSKISSSGSAQIDQVAGPIGEALIMTAFGLAVAIPAVLGYNTINRSNRLVVADLNRFANDLLAYFVTGARVAQKD